MNKSIIIAVLAAFPILASAQCAKEADKCCAPQPKCEKKCCPCPEKKACEKKACDKKCDKPCAKEEKKCCPAPAPAPAPAK